MSELDIRLVICHRGWIWVGVYAREETEIVIRRAKCLRRWGTTRGLGELRKGPTAKTILDEGGTVRLHPLQVINTLDVDALAWDKHLEDE
jgi:hypothetical protein